MPNKVYVALETTITFRDSAGDYVLTLNGLAVGVGRVSAQCDRGTGSHSKLNTVTAIVQAAASGFAIGDAIEIYIFQSDGTYVDGTVGVADAALTTDKRRNGLFVGALIADTTTASVDIVARFMDVPITMRYYSVGVWNASATRALLGTANTSRIIVTPQPDEIQ